MSPLLSSSQIAPSAGGPLATSEEVSWSRSSSEWERLDVGALVRRLLRCWWTVLIGLGLGLGLARWWLDWTPPRYESVATVRVEQERRPLLSASPSSTGAEDIRALEIVKTIEQEILSRENKARVVRRLDLATTPELSPDGSEWEAERSLTRAVRAELRRGTRLIDVRVEDTDATRASLIAAALVDEFILSSGQQAMAAARTKVEEVRQNLSRLEVRIRQAQADIQSYREAHPGLPIEGESSLAESKRRDLAAQLAQAVAERTRLELAQREIAALGSRPDVDAVLKIQGETAGEDVTSLKSSLAQKEAEFARLQQRYLPRHPKYIQAATELDSLRRQLGSLGARSAGSLAAAAAQAAATERGLHEQISRAESEVLAVEKLAGAYRMKLAQLASDRASFDSLQAQLQSAEVAAVSAPPVVTLVDAPVPAARPSKPRKAVAYAVAGTAGGLGGLCLGLLAMTLRRRYENLEALEQALQLPALAAIPRVKGAGSRPPLIDQPSVESVCAPAFRRLRSALSFRAAGRPSRITLFFGLHDGAGATFVAANHALGMARQGRLTLLIDADLHRAELDHLFFGRQNPDGIAGYFEGRGAPPQACRPTHVPGLFLFSAGHTTRDPSESVSAEKLRLLLGDAARWFDRIVIDTPSIDRADDALILSAVADQVVCVLDANRVRRGMIAEGVRRLVQAGVRPAGFVATRCSRRFAATGPAVVSVPASTVLIQG